MSELIRPARPGDIYGLIELWDLGFPGEHDFGVFIFSRFGSAENVLVVEDGGTLSAMLLMLPRTVADGSSRYSAGYIMGVTTRPEFRGRGIMKRLMDAAHENLRARGVDLAMLIPAEKSLFDYYARFGYSPFFYVERGEMNKIELSARYTVKEDSEDTDIFDGIYHAAMDGAIFVERCREDWLCAMEEHRRFGGKVLMLYRSVQPVSYVFFGQESGKVQINEALGLDDDAREAAIAAVFAASGAESVKVLTPAGETGQPFGAVLGLSPGGISFAASAQTPRPYINLIHN